MTQPWAEIVVLVVSVYSLLGLIFAIAFVVRGVQAVDPAAINARWAFRLLILPGAVAFWPLLGYRWLRGSQPPSERNAHRSAAR